MPAKKPKLDHPATEIDVEILPKEILCIIFSYLDKKSAQNASEMCKLWFELIRNDSNLSSYVFLKCDGLKELRTKIEKSEWIWNRWPVLKVLESGPVSINLDTDFLIDLDEPTSIQEAVDLVKSINFKDCPTLEKVTFRVNIDLQNFFPDFNSELKIATVEKLTFNPKSDIEWFGSEQISLLHITVDSSELTSSSISLSEHRRYKQNMLELFNDSTTTVKLTVGDMIPMDTIPMDTRIDYDFVTDLYVKDLAGTYLKNDAFFGITRMFQQFRKLKKCHVDVTVTTLTEWYYFEIQGPIIVDQKFQEMTEVKFVFKNCFTPIPSQGSDLIIEALEVTKMPFEESVSKIIHCKL